MLRSDLRPALIASAALHVGVALAGFVTWREETAVEPERELATSVPVTLVSAPAAAAAQSAPAPDPGPPEPAPEMPPPAPATQPVPPAPSPPAAARQPPRPEPRPAQPPKPGPGPAKPAPQKPAPRAEPGLDLDALSSRIASSNPRRPRSPQPGADPGSGGASPQELADARATLAARLNDAWNPNCLAPGGSRINVKVRFRLSGDGRVVGDPEIVGGPSGDPLTRAAQDRAVRAVLRLQPYDWMPKEALNETYAPTFNAQQACER